MLESKRMENLKAFHEALVKASKDEQEFVKSIFVRRTDAAKEAEEDTDDSDVEEE